MTAEAAASAAGSMDRRRLVSGVGLACLGFGLFATSDAAAKFLSRDIAVVQILFLSAAIAFLPSVALIWALDGLNSLRPRRPVLCLFRGVLTAISVLAIIWSFTRLPLAEGYALAFTAPLIVAGLAGWLLGETVKRRQGIAIVIGFLGVLVVLRPGFSAFDLGHAAALVSAVMFASSLILLRWIGEREAPGALLITYLIANLVIFAPFVDQIWVTPKGGLEWALIVWIGMASGLGQTALILAFRKAPAAIAAPFQYTQLIWGIAFGALLFDDQPDLPTIAGAFIVMGSGWFLQAWSSSRR